MSYYKRKCDLALQEVEISIEILIKGNNQNCSFFPMVGNYILIMTNIIKGYKEKQAELNKQSKEEQEKFYKEFLKILNNVNKITEQSSLFYPKEQREFVMN